MLVTPLAWGQRLRLQSVTLNGIVRHCASASPQHTYLAMSLTTRFAGREPTWWLSIVGLERFRDKDFEFGWVIRHNFEEALDGS